MRFPVLIKGRNGLSFYKTLHKKAIIANTPEELATTVKGIPPQVDFFIQEKIQNSHDEAISFSCFSVDGSIKSYWMGAKIREHPLRFGTATFAQSVLIPELLTEATPLISALSYTGICEIEFMFDERDGHYKLIEINPRTWLWVGLARRCGCDFALMMYNFANGIRQTFPSQYKVGVKWVNLMTDIPYSARLEPWIYAFSGELRAAFHLGKLFSFETRGGIEKIEGPEKRFEVNPAEGFVSFLAKWNFNEYLLVSQSVNYRSDARWNLRSSDPLVIKGDWFWNISLEQNFPNYGLSLSGTLLHIIGNDFLEVPGGGIDRTRFFCSIRKFF